MNELIIELFAYLNADTLQKADPRIGSIGMLPCIIIPPAIEVVPHKIALHSLDRPAGKLSLEPTFTICFEGVTYVTSDLQHASLLVYNRPFDISRAKVSIGGNEYELGDVLNLTTDLEVSNPNTAVNVALVPQNLKRAASQELSKVICSTQFWPGWFNDTVKCEMVSVDTGISRDDSTARTSVSMPHPAYFPAFVYSITVM